MHPAELLALVPVGLFVGMLALIACATISEYRRLNVARESFVVGRTPMTNEEFLAEIQPESGSEEFFLRARRIMAGPCKMEPEMLHPTDTMQTLLNLQFECGYIAELVISLERDFGVKLSYHYPPDDQHFDEYLRKLYRDRKS